MAKLDTKLKSLERSSLLSELTEEIMGGGGPLALIEPKVLDFVVTDPDKENTTTILLTNNTAEMELFKVNTNASFQNCKKNFDPSDILVQYTRKESHKHINMFIMRRA